MGICFASLQQMGMWDGSKREGFLTGQNFISYFQVESVLLEYPKVLEAGVIAQCDSTQGLNLRVYLALEEEFKSEEKLQQFSNEIIDFVRQHFSLICPIHVKVKDKLPMTRSGKILRTVLQEWN
jgi:acyl-coenzyme A synthetase/AMP-(fatty) acid ligase